MATVFEQWGEIKKAMKQFTYFDEWDETSIRECCILAKLKSFKPEDTILGDGRGLQDCVYFLLKGKCRMIEHIYIVTEVVRGLKRYKLHAQPESSPAVEVSESNSHVVDEISRELDSEELVSSNKGNSKTSIVNGVSEEAKENGQTEGHRSKRGSVSFLEGASAKEVKIEKSENKSWAIVRRSKGKTAVNGSKVYICKRSETTTPKNGEVTEELCNHTAVSSSTSESPTAPVRTVTPEVVFMQVCFFSPTACFGVGENLKNRRIIALSHVECLLIPRYWLLQKNKGNVWSRVRHTLKHIPTTEQIFEEFVYYKKWLGRRQRLVDGIFARKNISSDNYRNNVPYFIRIDEGVSFI